MRYANLGVSILRGYEPCDLPVLVPCAHALRQPRGFHLTWNEALYRFARRRPQLTRDPAARRPQRIRVCYTSLLLALCN